eukprot:3863513-Rhodomonas_salina.3
MCGIAWFSPCASGATRVLGREARGVRRRVPEDCRGQGEPPPEIQHTSARVPASKLHRQGGFSRLRSQCAASARARAKCDARR